MTLLIALVHSLGILNPYLCVTFKKSQSNFVSILVLSPFLLLPLLGCNMFTY
ncbi:hypothetical protein HanXRQr2_Chr07g0289641 [Helianthus annuus]|uniref:Uncharacterized protein n=1 Tax=Helianthus annuus TaxID=4232 RepID=A0A9K3IJV0_HELAN|nr:hypothetical protein HanXRQr2_Chr07g0289641 [Helianthus annuus]KAJ0904284.1 hypothetical protein HanPSC8_Chr07g0280331 [Helianthus annuus]